jgi:Protein of unknown function DUF262
MSEQLAVHEAEDGPRDDELIDLDEGAEVLPYTFSITSYGADYPVDGLVKRIREGDVVVPLFRMQPDEHDISMVGFQREYVWKKPQADRFIESLLLGLPVPGIFLVKEASGKLLVLDGHQRLRTLEGFYEGILGGSEFALESVQSRFQGKTYKSLEPEDRRRLDNSIIHATIVRQDEPSQDQSSIYLVFERLNSGGTILQPQEIRVALYHGPLVKVLSDLNDNADWRALYGKRSTRLKDIELILRFFALYFYAQQYTSPMKGFLNRYMAQNRDLGRQSLDLLRGTFTACVSAIRTGIGARAFRPKNAVNAAVVDSVMFGVASRQADRAIADPANLKPSYDRLLGDPEYQAATTRATANEEIVRKRLALAKDAFGSVA